MNKYFTLIEVIIAMAIIALLAVLAIPNLLRTRLNTNEGAAKATLKLLSTQAVTFSVQNTHYPQSLAVLANANPPFIDNTLSDISGAPVKQGYTFSYTSDDAASNAYGFWINASPVTPNVTGSSYYYIDEKNVICKGIDAAGEHAPSGAVCPAGFTPLQ